MKLPNADDMTETIANIPLDSVIDPTTAQQIMNSNYVVGLSPKFANLTISLGEPPYMPENWRGYCSRDGVGAMVFNQVGNATVVLCPQVFNYPTGLEIVNPPAWARDAQGRPLPGFSCDGLGDHDTDFMRVPASFVLHELVHWARPLDTIPEWTQMTQTDQGYHVIQDFWGPNPPDGYGPYNTLQLNLLSVGNPAAYGIFPAQNNADSYVWYALSKYWEWVCQRGFGPATSPDDATRRFAARAMIQDLWTPNAPPASIP